MAMDWIKNPGTQKALRIVGMGLFGLVVFVISIGFTLPEDRLKSFIESKAAKAGMALSIAELDAGGFGAVTLRGVRLEFQPAVSTAADGSRIEKQRSLDLDELEVNVNLLSTLFGSPSVTVTANQGAGHLGPVDIKVGTEAVEITIDEIVDFPLPGGLPVGPLALSGIIRSGSGHFLWNREAGLSGSEGTLEIAGDNMVVREPVLNSRQAGAISLTDISLGKLEASVIIDKRSGIAALKQGRRGAGGADSRVVYFDKFKLDGKDISAMVEGSSVIRLMAGRDMSKSQITVELAFAINDAFFEKTLKGSEDKPNKFLKTLLELDPRWKAARSGRFYGLICTGTLGDPNCIPRKPAVRGGEFKVPEKEDGDAAGDEAASRKTTTQRRRTQPQRVVQPEAGDGAGEEAGQVPIQRQPVQTGVDEEPANGEEGAGSQEQNGEVKLDPAAARVGILPRMTRPVTDNAQTRRVGGRIMDDSVRDVRSMESARPGNAIRMQEPGEPTEE